jgi:ABC-2 type transport system permease protein
VTALRRVRLLVAKDLLVLRRSPLLAAALLTYPLVIALLVGLVAGYGSSKPRVAFVDEDGLPTVVTLGGHRFHVDETVENVSRNVRLVRLPAAEARRQLATGRVVAVITVPPGFLDDLRTQVRSPTLLFQTAEGGVTPRITQQVQALVYSLNRQLQRAFIDTNLGYVRLILHGGGGTFLGRHFDVLGLDRTTRLLDQLPRGPRLDRIRDFVRIARLALAQTSGALNATANPIALKRVREPARSSVLSAQVQAYALGLTVAFLTLLLAAAALAAERDENVVGRLARGLVSLGELVGAKVALAAVVGAALGLAVALVFGLVIEVRNVVGGEPWDRLPLLVVGLLAAGASLGALGALLGAVARETRTASLTAILVVMPIVFLGLVPREVVPVAGYVSDALPFAHAVRYFTSALYDASPWRAAAREVLWLVGLGLAFGAAARATARRLLA